MKTTLIVFAFVFLLLNTNAQKNVNIRYNKGILENADVKITIVSAGSTEDFFKMKFDVTNKSKDFLVFRTSELKIKVKGMEYNFGEKKMAFGMITVDEFIIPPNETKTKMCDLKGSTFGSNEIQLLFDCIYKVSLENKTEIKTQNFTLPASEGSDFSVENFKLSVKKIEKGKNETKIVFKALYSGEKIGIIDFNKAKVLMPDAKEYNSTPSEHSPILFSKGNTKTFSLVFNNIPASAGNMERDIMIIKWSGVLTESVSKTLKLEVMNLKAQ